MGAVATVRIVSPTNPERCLRINATDLDPAQHTLWEKRNVKPSRPEHDHAPSAGRQHRQYPAEALQQLLLTAQTMPRTELLQTAARLGLRLDKRIRVQKLRDELVSHLQKMLSAPVPVTTHDARTPESRS